MAPWIAGLCVAVAFVATGCAQPAPTPSGSTTVPPGTQQLEPSVTATGDRLRYVALGDSYTIGTSVSEGERWPNQLVAAIPGLQLVANLGVNGFTSRDVIEVELPQLEGLRPEVITILIGVNDVVQGVPAETYRANVIRIFDDAVDRVGAARVFVVTTPDYTVTPSGSDFGDPALQAQGIRENNRVISELAAALGITVIDVYDISLAAEADRSLVAGDGLHPSGRQYALWVERIAPAMGALVGEAGG